MDMGTLCLCIVLAPLAAGLIAGFFGSWIGRVGAHWLTTSSVGISCLLSLLVYKQIIFDDAGVYNAKLYTWGVVGGVRFELGFLIDALSVTMMAVVTFVSFMIHIYTIGYMRDDPGYQRFFSYISLFTFAMLILVMSNNFLQLFFGWEAVGLVSYLLIGFWYKRQSAIFASLKAFLVNRVGDFGFLLGLAAIAMYFNSFDYVEVFAAAPAYAHKEIVLYGTESWLLMTFICLCLFTGAMGKSAQIPLHVWLPDSMEGPTPISALIHAATMVTAGIFMVARMSPLFELSEAALNFMLIIGALTAFFMGLLGLVQHDIKRVIAYSTLSQLGYMTVALGASAYSAAIFHLVTHAFFKALLFLAAGSVIIGMHHEQDMRKMGGLFKRMPITWLCCFTGTIALIGFPGTAGFFSKDAIIEAVYHSALPAADLAWYAVLSGVVFTALYSFRLFFLTFHGENRMTLEQWRGTSESPWVVTIPLILLALPSLIIGWFLVEPMLFGDYFGDSIYVSPQHDVLAVMALSQGNALTFFLHAFESPKVLLLMAVGVALAWWCYIRSPTLPGQISRVCSAPYQVLVRKYGFDSFNQLVFAGGAIGIGRAFWKIGDVRVIDNFMVNGLARLVSRLSERLRWVQSGYLYHYAFVMIIGLLLLLILLIYGIL